MQQLFKEQKYARCKPTSPNKSTTCIDQHWSCYISPPCASSITQLEVTLPWHNTNSGTFGIAARCFACDQADPGHTT
jgi:hypothetical protein